MKQYKDKRINVYIKVKTNMKDLGYFFWDESIIRTPALPWHKQVNEIDIDLLIKDQSFLEAIYVATSVLYAEIIKYSSKEKFTEKEVHKLKTAILKYYTRMSTRCTPFGLFSNCGVVNWGSETKIEIDTSKKLRHTRFDMHYLGALAQHLSAIDVIRENLLYYPNSSIYLFGNEIRYIEYKYKNGIRQNVLNTVEGNDTIIMLLEKTNNGLTYKELIDSITNNEVSCNEATEFVNLLIDEQLLVNNLEIAITGTEYLDQIMATLHAMKPDKEIVHWVTQLTDLQTCLHNLDANEVNSISKYEIIEEKVSQLGIPFEKSKLFQIDCNVQLIAKKINSQLQQHILEALNFLNKFSAVKENQQLETFAKRFYERYEDGEMPLMQVLDVETGIGYVESRASDIIPLVEDIFIEQKANNAVNATLHQKDILLAKKIVDAAKSKKNYIELTDDDLKDVESNWDNLMPSIPIMYNVINDNEIVLGNAGGSSAINLLSRFGHANTAISNMALALATIEQEKNEAVVFAEIVHLPENRVGNILLHPIYRKYEIPFLAKAAVEDSFKITLDDLYISVVNQKIKLSSKTLQKEIIPRLSNAHNYSANAMPVYQFLCDLQCQAKKTGIGFSWGILEAQHKYLPRVTYKNIIVSLAQWAVSKKDIEDIIKYKDDAVLLLSVAKELCNTLQMPTLVVLVDADNELLINWEDATAINIFIQTVKNRESFLLKEVMFDANKSPVYSTAGNKFNNQIISVLVKKEAAYKRLVQNESIIHSQEKVISTFSIGSEWLYYKIYCGLKVADEILLQAIQPAVNALQEKGLIKKFFFIRYTDPSFHIRVRFLLYDVNQIGEVMVTINKYTSIFEKDNKIWKTQLDTYKRECNRYGLHAIELAESLFYHDSMATLNFLHYSANKDRTDLRWKWAILAIDILLERFGYDIAQKSKLLEILKINFHAEFNSGKMLIKQLSIKYRQEKLAIEHLFDVNNELNINFNAILQHSYLPVKEIHTSLVNLINNNTLNISIPMLLQSYIHMLVNRIVSSNPRLHELVIYDMMFTYYQSKIARNKFEQTANQINA